VKQFAVITSKPIVTKVWRFEGAQLNCRPIALFKISNLNATKININLYSFFKFFIIPDDNFFLKKLVHDRGEI